MIEENKRKSLIEYRIEQAEEAIAEAKLLIDNDKLRAAINRIYYGMFYILLALGIKYNFETSKHAQLIGWFNKTFIKNNILDKRYGEILREAFKFRQQGDYAAYFEFSKNEVLEIFEDMKSFISDLKSFILRE